MHRAALVAGLFLIGSACAGPRAPAAATAAPAPAPAAAPRAAPPTAAQITKLSHDLLDAYDRGDVAALEAGFAADLVHFEGGEPSGRAEELDRVRKRPKGVPYIAARSWEDETVKLFDDSAVFTGKATETQGGNDKKGGYKYVGWYLLEWVRRGDAWQAKLWTWQRAGAQSERDTWNDIYRNGVGFEKVPNRLLAETIRGVRPGTALDLAMGQGRNALHLAAQGWRTTGVDLSDEGIRLARAEAKRRRLEVEMIEANIDQYDLGTDRWDLVTMIYAGADVAWIEKIKPSLRRGGLFVVEFFANDPDAGVLKGFAPGQLATLFAGYEILRDEVVEDAPDWARDRAKLVRFVARKR